MAHVDAKGRFVPRCSQLLLLALLAVGACADSGDDDEQSVAGAGAGGAGGAGASGVGGSDGGSGGAPSGGTGAGTSGVGVSDSGAPAGSDGDAAASDGGGPIADGAVDDAGAVDVDAAIVALPEQSCLNGIVDYVAAGPFDFEAMTIGKVKVWVPEVPDGCKLPVVHFANGTGATCSSYVAVLEHLASHGFLAACYESTTTGEGLQCIEAVETVYAQLPELASTVQVGFSGHGVGGVAGFLCTYRAQAKWGGAKLLAGYAFAPESGSGGSVSDWQTLYAQIDAPMFIINGDAQMSGTDGLVSEGWVRDGYEALASTTEAYWYTGVGATHIPLPTEFFQESTVAWFRWKLLRDRAACEYFKAMPDGERWDLREQQNAVACD